MPTRQLKPGLVASLRYNTVSWPAQALFTRLLALVDDYARYDAHPLIVARAAFPYGDPKGRPIRPEQVSEWLNELEKARLAEEDLPLLSRYKVEGVEYLVLHRWTERVRSMKSRYPAPPFEQTLEFASRLSCLETVRGGLPANASQNGKNDGICQPMPANAGQCPPTPANAGQCWPMLPSSSSSSSSSSTGVQKKGGGGVDGTGLRASIVQFAALRDQVRAMEARAGELTAKQMGVLAEKKRDLRRLQKKQAAGEF